jgi:hypothetical protein
MQWDNAKFSIQFIRSEQGKQQKRRQISWEPKILFAQVQEKILHEKHPILALKKGMSAVSAVSLQIKIYQESMWST